ncbi:hypothetical protein D3C73_1611010 [compost metagenome]
MPQILIGYGPIEVIYLPVQLILHLLLGATLQYLVGFGVTRIDIVVANMMSQRSSLK